MIPSAEIIPTVKAVLEKDRRVALGYIFGSTARDQVGPLSDVDVAVLPLEEEPPDKFPGRLADDLCRALRTDRVDLVDLRRTAPPLRYRVIRDGRLLLSRDEGLRQRFETASIMRYLDMRPIRKRAFSAARKQIREEAQ
jgi:hypothetical protein